jgi:hypothetical protein
MKDRDLSSERLDAQKRAAAAKSDFEAADRKAHEETKRMSEVSGLDAAKKDAKTRVETIKEGVHRLHDDFVEWDDARERRMFARLDAADAKLREWKARDDELEVEADIEWRKDLDALEESAALTRARLAEWNSSRHARAAAESLEDAARHFDQAFDAATRRYE